MLPPCRVQLQLSWITTLFKGRGNSTTAFTAYGDELFHNAGDKIQLECELGFANSIGKKYMQAECKCDGNGDCAWQKKDPNWTCVNAETEQVQS